MSVFLNGTRVARELRGFVDATGQLQDDVHPRPTDRLVLGERALELVGVRADPRTRRRPRWPALHLVRRPAWSRGVADEDEAAGVPAPERLEVIDVVSQDRVLVGGSATSAIGSCQPEKRRTISAFRPCGSSGAPSGAFLVANQYVRPRPMSTSPKRSLNRHDSVRRPTYRHWGDAAPCRGEAGIADRHVGDRSTYDGPRAVGADEQLAPLLAAIGGYDGDAFVLPLDSCDLDAEAHFRTEAASAACRSARWRAIVPSSRSEGPACSRPSQVRIAPG